MLYVIRVFLDEDRLAKSKHDPTVKGFLKITGRRAYCGGYMSSPKAIIYLAIITITFPNR